MTGRWPSNWRPAHIVWDWNGTLLDDTGACIAALNTLLRERRLPQLDDRRYRESFGFPVRAFYRKLGIDPEAGDWDALAARFHDLYLQQEMTVSAAAHAALRFVAAAGVPQSVLSACEQGILERLIARYGLSGRFRHVQGADNLDGQSKIAAGRALLTRLGVAARELLLIGDTLHDAEVAAAVGCYCLLVASGHQSRARLAGAGCPVIPSLAALPGLLPLR